MRTKADLGRGRKRGRRRKPRQPGGKVLQRLFTYLGQRDPAFNNDLIAVVPVPKKVRPSYALTKQAMNAKKQIRLFAPLIKHGRRSETASQPSRLCVARVECDQVVG